MEQAEGPAPLDDKGKLDEASAGPLTKALSRLRGDNRALRACYPQVLQTLLSHEETMFQGMVARLLRPGDLATADGNLRRLQEWGASCLPNG